MISDALWMISGVHMKESSPSRVSVPSRGLCYLGKHDLEKVVRLGSAFLAGAFDFWEKHEPWLLLPCYSMTMEIAKLLRAPRHAPTQVAKA